MIGILAEAGRVWRAALVTGTLVLAAMANMQGAGQNQSQDPSRDPSQNPSRDPSQDPSRNQMIVTGRKIFAGSCGMAYCHGSDGAGGSGPRLRDRSFSAARLTKVITNGIPGTAMPAFGKGLKPEQITQIVSYLLSVNREEPAEKSEEQDRANLDPHLRGGRPGDNRPVVRQGNSPLVRVAEPVVGAGRATGLIGDWRSGQDLFFGAAELGNCRVCHTLHGRGGKVASDLSRLSGAPSPDILRRLLAPRALEGGEKGQYALITITLRSGERVTGIRRDESDGALRLFDTATLPPVSRNYTREEIVKVETVDASGCPGGYAAKFTLQQLIDLIALIKTVDAARPATVTADDLIR